MCNSPFSQHKEGMQLVIPKAKWAGLLAVAGLVCHMFIMAGCGANPWRSFRERPFSSSDVLPPEITPGEAQAVHLSRGHQLHYAESFYDAELRQLGCRAPQLRAMREAYGYITRYSGHEKWTAGIQHLSGAVATPLVCLVTDPTREWPLYRQGFVPAIVAPLAARSLSLSRSLVGRAQTQRLGGNYLNAEYNLKLAAQIGLWLVRSSIAPDRVAPEPLLLRTGLTIWSEAVTAQESMLVQKGQSDKAKVLQSRLSHLREHSSSLLQLLASYEALLDRTSATAREITSVLDEASRIRSEVLDVMHMDDGSSLKTQMEDSSGISSYTYELQGRLESYAPPLPSGYSA